jgi:hypothetical protein
MDRMNGKRMEERLDALWAEYRTACGDPEPGADFMPKLWEKIEGRRVETTSVFRRMAQAWVMAAVALTLLILVLLPRLQREPIYSANTYVEVLDDAHSTDVADLLAGGEVE